MSYVLEDVVTLRQHSCFDKTKLTNVDQISWITIKKFYYRVRYEIFYESATAYFITKCNGLSNWLQTATTFFFVLLQSTTGFITLRQGLQNVTIIPRATVRAFLHRPSPPLSLKACRDCMQSRKSFSFKFVCAYLVKIIFQNYVITRSYFSRNQQARTRKVGLRWTLWN